MVAAGGGGGSKQGSIAVGGAGGGITANNISNRGIAYGGTQTKGGVGAISAITGGNGSFGLGGSGKSGNSGYSGGGGGGYFGGGGGGVDGSADDDGAGAGGSSYISGQSGCNSYSDTNVANQFVFIGSSYHYSGKYFINTVMVDGNGVLWNGETTTNYSMPTHDGTSTMTGNAGNGYAKITIRKIESKSNDELTAIADSTDSMWVYTYVGDYQEFTVKVDGVYHIDAYGAEGGARGNLGGKGAYIKGDIYLTKGTKFYIYVGGAPDVDTTSYNGGASGWAAGGGATDIRTVKGSSWDDFDSLKSRIMVAAGGGGGSKQSGVVGGSGGALAATDISGRGIAYGGKQNIGGFGAASTYNGSAGGFGMGGSGTSGSSGYSGGGGGGYYGGGGGGVDGGGDDDGSGAGGSSYISGYTGCDSLDENSTSNNIIHTGNSNHYSGYVFTNSQMQAGVNSGSGKVVIQLINITSTAPTTNNQTVWTYSANQKYEKFTAPYTGTYSVQLWGAQGSTRSNAGGKGAYTSGEITLTKGTTLYVYVGTMPTAPYTIYNGGGAGWAAGGGATDIRVTPTSQLTGWNEAVSLKSRIMVAAGGGGGSKFNAGGAGGGLAADNTSGRGIAYGGTQVAGGSGATSTHNGGPGSFGIGGTGTSGHDGYSAGGGAGWYGGGGGGVDGGSDDDGGGAGGSSYISGHEGCIAVTSNGTAKTSTYSDVSDSVSYTGYRFMHTVMIDGAGYSWSTTKSSASSGMPTYDGLSTMIGNTGNGYAKITYLGE